MNIIPISKISGRSDLLSTLSEAWQDHFLVEKGDPSRVMQLRCSALPYCPTSAMVNYVQRGGFRAMDMRMAFYISVGHAVHDVFQNFLAQTGRLIADYECEHCGKKFPFSTKIEHCGGPTKYNELGVAYKGVHGHVDALFKDRKGRYWIVDFKTCSLSGMQGKINKVPVGYHAQVRAYAYLVWKQYGIKIAGVMLMYIPRDNPAKPGVWEEPLDEEDFDKIRDFLKKQVSLHRRTMVAQTREEFEELLSHCKQESEFCSICKMGQKEQLRVLMKGIEKFPIKK